MDVAAIRDQVYSLFGDEANVQINDTDVTNWINSAMRHIVDRNDKLFRNEASLVNLVAGTATYNLPATMFMLQDVRIKRETDNNSYYQLEYLTTQQMTEYGPEGWDGSDLAQGTPTVFFKESNGVIRLHPVPDESITNGLKIVYTRYPTDVTTTGTDVPELPLYYHEAIFNYVMMRAYIKDENWEAASSFSNMLKDELNTNTTRETKPSVDYYQTITIRAEDAW